MAEVVDCAGSEEKLEVAGMDGVDVAEVVDCVGHLQEKDEKR